MVWRALRLGIQAETEGVAALHVVLQIEANRIRSRGDDREIAAGLGRLDALRVGGHVLVDEINSLVHGRRDLFLLLRGDLALHAAWRRLRRRRGQWLLLDLPVRSIEHLLLDAGLLLPLHADDGRLDPPVLGLQLRVGGQRLLQRRDLVLLGPKPVREGEQAQYREPRLPRSNASEHHKSLFCPGRFAS